MPSNTTTITDQTVFAQDEKPTLRQEAVIWIDTTDPRRTTYVYSTETQKFEPVSKNLNFPFTLSSGGSFTIPTGESIGVLGSATIDGTMTIKDNAEMAVKAQ